MMPAAQAAELLVELLDVDSSRMACSLMNKDGSIMIGDVRARTIEAMLGKGRRGGRGRPGLQGGVL